MSHLATWLELAFDLHPERLAKIRRSRIGARPVNIALFGSGEFALPALEGLNRSASRHPLVAVISRPDQVANSRSPKSPRPGRMYFRLSSARSRAAVKTSVAGFAAGLHDVSILPVTRRGNAYGALDMGVSPGLLRQIGMGRRQQGLGHQVVTGQRTPPLPLRPPPWYRASRG